MKTWLQKSYLTQTPDLSCLLLVDSSTYDLINNLSFLSTIYPFVVDVYPDATSLHLSSSTVQHLLEQSYLEVYSIEVD